MPTSADAPSHSLRDLAATLGIEAPADDLAITGLNTIEAAGPSELTFLANERYAVRLKESQAGVALVPADFDGDVPMPLLRTANPRMAFARLMELFHPRTPHTPGIHPSASIAESATIGADVTIGAFVVIGENARIGDRTVLHPHAVVYPDVVLGDDCEIHSHVSLREGSKLGHRVIIHNGTVIGADGFGFEPDEKGQLYKVPQVGIVEIGDDVEIQANACVDRAALGATVIGTGAKIDNFAQIAHGCIIGEHSVICGQVGLAGSTKVGKHVLLGGQVGSAGHVQIGDGVQAAAKTGIMMDVPPGAVVGGVPAMPIKDALRSTLALARLPDLVKRVKKLERWQAALDESEGEDA